MEFLGRDLLVVPHFQAHDASPVDLVRTRRPIVGRLPSGAMEAFDLSVVSGRENLAQALILRLLTPRGSLAALGHAGYGSRLVELIGRPKVDATRHLCRAFVLEALAQEPRVEPKAVSLTFDSEAETPSSLRFTLAVRPRDGGDPVAFALEVGLL
jgi:phage baseplate assembly protein W